jgi:hypothetical protein
MPKVITGAGLQEFIETGKHDVIAPQKKGDKEAPALEVKKEVVLEIKPPEEPKAEAKPEVKVEEDGLEPEDKDLSEIIRKKIGKKHRAMKEAQEAASDAETFAKGQYDRARLAEERAGQLEKQLEEARKAVAPPVPEAKEPDLKEYTDDKGQIRWQEYTLAVAKFAADRAVQEDRARQAQDKEAAERAEAARKFKEKADKIDGFADKLSGSQVWFPNAVLEYITESEDGPEIVMHLLNHPETAEQISKLRPIKAIAEIGKIVKGFGGAKAVVPAAPVEVPIDRGGAPPPITPISGSGTGTINTDPARMSFKELREFERARRKKH